MNIEIYCKENLNLIGKTFYREAVRAIIIKDAKILLIYSEKNEDYKFPGGGVESGETYVNALIREVKEESGATVKSIKEFGKVTEYDEGQIINIDLFKMLSIYYICKIEEEFGKLNLDSYEIDLGFIPKWVTIEEAISSNNNVMKKSKFPRWTKRETEVLEYLKVHLAEVEYAFSEI